MALKALMLKKSLDAKRSALAGLEEKKAEFEKREAELTQAIEEAKTDEERSTVEAEVEKFDADKAENEQAQATLRSEIEGLENELKDAEEAAPAPEVEERQVKKMAEILTRDSKEYVEAFAKYIKTGKAEEVRTLLTENASGGTVAVPTFVEEIIHTAWDNNGILSRVSKSTLPGNVKIGFEISATGAEVHTEGGEAIDEETLTLGIVSLIPSTLKKWIRVTTEIMDMRGDEFISYIYREVSYQIMKALADQIVTKIAALPTTATATSVNAAKISAAPAMGTVATAIANLSDEAVRPVVIMNKLTYAAFKAVQYDNNFNADPFEGLEVIFNNSLPAYASASATNVYMIVGDLGFGVRANYPGGEDIKFVFDEYTEAEADLVKIVGRQYVATGVIAPKAFTNVAKPATV